MGNQRWSKVILSTVLQRCFLNAETTSTSIRQLNFHVQSNNYVKRTLSHQRWNNVILSTLFQRYLVKVETTVINVRQLKFYFQPNINGEATLMDVDGQHCFNVDSTLMCLLGLLSWDVALLWKSPYLTEHLKINYETGCTRRFSEKTWRRIQDHHNI